LANQDPSSPARKPPPPPGLKKSGSSSHPIASPTGSSGESSVDEIDLDALVLESDDGAEPAPRASEPEAAPKTAILESFEGAPTIAVPSTQDLARESAAMADEWVADLAQTSATTQAPGPASRLGAPAPTRVPTGARLAPPPGAVPPRPAGLPPIRRTTSGSMAASADERPTLLQSPEERAAKAAAGSAGPVRQTVLGALAPAVLRDLDDYRRALQAETQPQRLGRVHYEIGRIYELIQGDLDEASRHYGRALASLPDALPVIVAARRVMIARGEYGNALELFDRELQQTRDVSQRAALSFMKGRLLEDHLRQPLEARKAYAAAVELAGSDAVVLEAQARVDTALQAWRAVSEDYGRLANAVAEDTRLRAALVVRRARLAEVHAHDAEEAAQLYEAALALDPEAPGALDALKRLHHERRRWRELIAVLEREVGQSRDASTRMMALYRIGLAQAERLGNRDEGIAAFERAAAEVPGATFVLEALARLYEQAQAYPELCSTLRRLAGATTDARQRLGYLHRIGDLSRDALGDADAALAAYEAALAIDPTYVPALRALSLLYAARGQWPELVKMHEAEVEATVDTPRRAAAHARAAMILERLEQRTEAIAHHEHALALDPELGESFRALVRLYTRTGEHHKLIELYERVLDRVDIERRIEYLFNIADIYNGALRQPERAIEVHRRILALRPKHIGAVHAMQRVAENANLFPALVDALELEAQIVRDNKDVVALLYRAGAVLHEDMGAPHEAIVRCRKVLELDGHHRPTLASLGRIYYAAGQWEELVEIYRLELDVTAESSAKVALLHKMGELYAGALAQTERAVACFRQALALDPRHGPSTHQLARILREQGDWAALVRLSEDAIQHASTPADAALAAYRTGEIYEEFLGEKEAAERAFSTALSLRPQDRPAADALVRVRTQLGHWNELAQELEQRASAVEDSAAAVSMLVFAAQVWSEHVKDDAHAIACYEQVLTLAPHNLVALAALEELYRKRKDWVSLAENLAAQERIVTDPGAKAALLVERVRVLENHVPDSRGAQAACHRQLLALGFAPRVALDGLERLAIARGDVAGLSDIDGHLVALATDPTLQSAHLTRLAEALEARGEPSALETFRQAVQLHRDNWAAQRGLARTAERQHDGPAMAEAAEIAAETASSPAEAATAWVRCAEIRLEALGDADGGLQALDKALTLDPDHAAAAERLGELHRSRGAFEPWVERISRAAASARRPERQSQLWITVARIYEQELGNMGAALSAVRRLCELQPQNLDALLEQARLLTSDRRFDEAVGVLGHGLTLTRDAETRYELESLLARCHESLDDPERALAHYAKALELRPEDQGMLGRMVDLQLQRRSFKAACEAATRLVQMSRNDEERVKGLLRLARARSGMGQIADAIDHLAEATALGGGRHGSDREIRAIARESEHWNRYIAALRQRLDGLPDVTSAAVYLEIARVQHEYLGQAEEGMTTIIEGLRRDSSNGDLRLELAERLKDRDRHVEAIEQFQYLLMDEVARAEVWRGLGQTFERLGQLRERDMTACALVVLGAASPVERAQAAAWRSACAAVGPGAFAPAAVPELYVARQQQEPTANLIAAMTEGIAKVRPPDLNRWGVGFRDKLGTRSESVLRSVIDHVARVIGVEDFEVYVHHQPDLGVSVEPLAKPTLLVPARLAERPASTQVFQLAYAMFNAARGLHPLQHMSSQELGILLAAAARLGVPGYRSTVASEAVLDEQAKAIARGIPRRKRKQFEDAADVYARSAALDPSTFLQWSRQTARRVALIFADDLEAAIEQVALEERVGDSTGSGRFERSPVLADLLKVWVSKPAMAIRQRMRIVTPALPPTPA